MIKASRVRNAKSPGIESPSLRGPAPPLRSPGLFIKYTPVPREPSALAKVFIRLLFGMGPGAVAPIVLKVASTSS